MSLEQTGRCSGDMSTLTQRLWGNNGECADAVLPTYYTTAHGGQNTCCFLSLNKK